MNCMKCGRETASGQVFCDACLEEMEKYPVKPGTVVRLPHRREEPGFKKNHPRRKMAAPEEQVKSLKKAVRRLIVTVVLLAALLGVAGYFAVVHLLETQTVFLPGQNYSSIMNQETTEAEGE